MKKIIFLAVISTGLATVSCTNGEETPAVEVVLDTESLDTVHADTVQLDTAVTVDSVVLDVN
jgi:hypothetical protein